MQRCVPAVDWNGMLHDHAERQWLARHEPAVQAWLGQRGYDELAEEDLGARQEARFAAHVLLGVSETRACGHVPGEPERKPYSWDEIDAYEVLFENYLQAGGCIDGWDDGRIIASIRDFARFVGHCGLMDRALSAALQRDFDVWVPRALDVLAGGRWRLRDGSLAPLPPAPPEPPPTVSGTRRTLGRAKAAKRKKKLQRAARRRAR